MKMGVSLLGGGRGGEISLQMLERSTNQGTKPYVSLRSLAVRENGNVGMNGEVGERKFRCK